MIDYLALYDKMRENNIMLTFKGEVSFDLINSVLKIMEDRLDKIEIISIQANTQVLNCKTKQPYSS